MKLYRMLLPFRLPGFVHLCLMWFSLCLCDACSYYIIWTVVENCLICFLTFTPLGQSARFKDIVKHYCCSFIFFVDTVSILPLEIMCLAADAGEPRWRMFCLLRLNRVLKFLKVKQRTFLFNEIAKFKIWSQYSVVNLIPLLGPLEDLYVSFFLHVLLPSSLNNRDTHMLLICCGLTRS